jgi:hypothetical protein
LQPKAITAIPIAKANRKQAVEKPLRRFKDLLAPI